MSLFFFCHYLWSIGFEKQENSFTISNYCEFRLVSSTAVLLALRSWARTFFFLDLVSGDKLEFTLHFLDLCEFSFEFGELCFSWPSAATFTSPRGVIFTTWPMPFVLPSLNMRRLPGVKNSGLEIKRHVTLALSFVFRVSFQIINYVNEVLLNLHFILITLFMQTIWAVWHTLPTCMVAWKPLARDLAWNRR